MRTVASERPVRVAIFEFVVDVARAVQGLVDAGFRKEHVSVVCSDRAKEELFAGTSAAFGTFVDAMMSRGVEDEVADCCDQALPRGVILVAAEIDAHDDVAMLERAERVFEEAGAHPVALPHG